MSSDFLSGVISMSLLVIAMFFGRFWRRTHDRLFIYFAAAFLVMMVEQIIRAASHMEVEWAPYIYSVRLLAFVLILIAVVDKNRRG